LVNYFWRFKLTSAGKCLVGCGIIANIFTITLQTLDYLVLLPLFGIGFLAFCANCLHRPRLDIKGVLGEKTIAGHETNATITVTNKGRLPALDISVGFFKMPRSLVEVPCQMRVAVLPKGESATFSIGIKALKRGVYELAPVRAFSTFPLNLCRSGSRKKAMGSLLVQPSFTPAGGIDVPVSARYQPGGIALTSNLGESPEYVGNREYRPGDSVRRIDARAWARLCKPVVREYQEEYFCRIALVLDTFIPGKRRSKPEGFPQLEAGISLAATVTDALSRGEYILDIFAAGPELYCFRSGRHTAHFENVLEILACLDACRTNPFDVIAPALVDELQNMSTAIFVMLDWDEARQKLVRMASSVGCRCKVLIVRDEPTTLPVSPSEEADIQTYTTGQVNGGGFATL